MKKFTEQIFMGNANREGTGTTDRQISLLKKQLDKALSNLSGIQQLESSSFLEGWTNADIKKEDAKITRQNREIARNIVMAITGEKIEFIK